MSVTPSHDSPVPNTTAPTQPGAVPQPRSGGRGIPLSPAQQAALLPERLRGATATNLFVALEVSTDLDPADLDRAAVSAVSRHEILRTIYPDDRRIPYQRVVDAPDTVVETIEGIDPAELNTALLADAAYGFDPVREPPIRIRLYRMPDRAVVTIAAHPVAADDHTLDLLSAELLDGTAAEPVAQYRSYAMAQMKTLVGDAAADPDLSYWLQRLAELPQRAVPAENLATAVESGRIVSPSARRTVRIPAATFASLTVTPETAVAAVLAAVLGEAGLGTDVPIGIVATGRTGPQQDSALGAYANQLVLRVDVASAATPRALLDQVAEAAAAARAHASARIERITHQLRGAAAVADGAPFQVLVNARAEVPAREIARQVARPHGVDVVADVVTGAETVTVTLDFPAALAGRPEIDTVATAVEQWPASWAAAPEAPLPMGELPALFERPAAHAGGTGLGGEPGTEAERLIADTIRAVLELDEDDEIGRADTFFSLGGDSIAALRLVTVLGERGYALDVQKVFEFPAVHELAAQLTAAEPAPNAEPAAPVAPMSASGLDPAALAALGKKFAGR